MTSEVSLGAGGAKMAGADSKLADVVRTPRASICAALSFARTTLPLLRRSTGARAVLSTLGVIAAPGRL